MQIVQKKTKSDMGLISRRVFQQILFLLLNACNKWQFKNKFRYILQKTSRFTPGY